MELVELELYCEPFLVYDWSSTKKKDAIAIQDLDYSKLWLLEEGHCLRTQVQNICELSNKSEQKNINIEFKAGSLGSLLRFTKANKGITIIPYLASIELAKDEKQKLVPFNNPTPVRTIGLITHKHFVKRKLLKKLQSVIQESVVLLIPSGLEIKTFRPL